MSPRLIHRILITTLLLHILLYPLSISAGNIVIYEGPIIYGATYNYPDMSIVAYNGTTVNNTLYLKPGDLIAPHLYDWYFQWGDYIKIIGYNEAINNTNISYLFSCSQIIKSSSGTPKVVYVSGRNGYVMIAYNSMGNYMYNVHRTYIPSEWIASGISIPLNKSVIDILKINYSSNTIKGYSNYGNGSDITIKNEIGEITIIIIASSQSDVNQFEGYIKYAGYTRDTITVNDLQNHIVSKPEFILDPTWIDNNNYISLVNNAVGIPYGGVKRIEASEKWLWVVRNYTGQPYVLLKSFNEDSSWIIDGELHSDGAQFIGEGWHEVKLYYPVNATGMAITGLPNNAIVAVYDLDSDKAYFGLSSNGVARIHIDHSIRHGKIILYTSSEQRSESLWYNDPGSVVTIVLISTVLAYFVIKIIRYIEEHF